MAIRSCNSEYSINERKTLIKKMEYVTTKEITLKLEQKMYSVRVGGGG